MDQSRATLLRELLASSGWTDRTRWFARALRQSTAKAEPLLLVGTPDEEPWHFAAHLDDESRLADLPGLKPTLVRYQPPPGAPPHLAIGLERLAEVRRGETLFVVAPDAPPEQLLDRVERARKSGLTILSIDGGDDDLADLAHEQLVVPTSGADAPGALTAVRNTLITPEAAGVTELSVPTVSFDAVEHLVSLAAGEPMKVLAKASSRRSRFSRLVEETATGRRNRSEW